MYVNFNTYFEDELNWDTPIDEILEKYNWSREIQCSCCGKMVSIFNARFNPDYDTARCAECATE